MAEINVQAVDVPLKIDEGHGFTTTVTLEDLSAWGLTGSETWEGDIRLGQDKTDARPGGGSTKMLNVTGAASAGNIVLTITLTDANAVLLTDESVTMYYTIGIVGDRAYFKGEVQVGWSVLA